MRAGLGKSGVLSIVLKVLDVHPLAVLEAQGPAAEADQSLTGGHQGLVSALCWQQEGEPARPSPVMSKVPVTEQCAMCTELVPL